MKINLELTSKIVEFNGVPARVWEGKTESGIEVIAFITRIAVAKEDTQEEFKKELMHCKPPSEGARSFPYSLLID